MAGGPLLVERLAADPVWIAGHRDGTTLEMGKQQRCHRGVVLDQVAFGVAVFGEEHLVDVGERDGTIDCLGQVSLSVFGDPHRRGEVGVGRGKGAAPSPRSMGARLLDLLPDEPVTRHVPGLGDEHHRHVHLFYRLEQRADPERPLPVGDMSDLTGGAELVVGELSLEGGDHPAGEAVPHEGENRHEGLFGDEPAIGHGVDVGPVDHRPHEGVLRCELGDVPEAAELAPLAGGLEAEAHAQRVDLWGDDVDAGADPSHQSFRVLVVG